MLFYKRAEGLMVSQQAFQLVVREITMELVPEELRDDIRWQKTAIEALQQAAEFFITDVLSMAQLAAIHARRETVMMNACFLSTRCIIKAPAT